MKKSRYDYTKKQIVRTHEDIDDGEKFLRRKIYLGTFVIEDGIWDLNSSSLEFEGSFEIVPNANKTIYND